MSRTRELTIHLLRQIINQKKLRGGLDSRTSAVKAATDLLAAVRMNTGCEREWIRSRPCDDFVAEQRAIAGSARLGPGIRVDALRRLCVLAGYSNVSILGGDAADQYTRSLLKPTEVSTQFESKGNDSGLSEIETALRRYHAAQGGTGQ
jgi:hypothetical protein